MSSPAVTSSPAPAKRGRPAKRSASEISTADSSQTPLVPTSFASTTIIPPEISAASLAAAAAPGDKKRKPRAPKAAAASNAADVSMAGNDSSAPVASSSDAPKKSQKPRKPRAPKAAAPPADSGAASTGGAPVSARAASSTPAPQVVVTYSLFGDENLPVEQQATDAEAYAQWKAHLQTLLCVKQSQWAKAKKTAIKLRKKQAVPPKRTIQKDDLIETAANTRARISKFDTAAFASLAGAWLSTYGGTKFADMYTAEQLKNADVRAEIYAANNVHATSALVVYDLAVEKGFQPLGIVSERSKKEPGTETLINVVKVDEPRVYVGPALPFRNIAKSVFAKASEDTVKVKTTLASINSAEAAAGGAPVVLA